jgi:hypothetical protein
MAALDPANTMHRQQVTDLPAGDSGERWLPLVGGKGAELLVITNTTYHAIATDRVFTKSFIYPTYTSEVDLRQPSPCHWAFHTSSRGVQCASY